MSVKILNKSAFHRFYSSIGAFIIRDIKIKDNDLILGVLYTILKPLFFVIVVSVAISFGFKGTSTDEVILTFTFPLVFWFYFNDTALQAANCLGVNADLRSLPNIQPISIMIGVVLSNTILTFILLCLIVTGMLFYGTYIFIPNILLSFLLLFFFTMCYSLLVSVIFFDNSFALKMHELFLRALFFASSVIVPVSIFPNSFQEVLYLNPLAQIMDISRSINLNIDNQFLSYEYVIISSIFMLVVFFALYRLKVN